MPPPLPSARDLALPRAARALYERLAEERPGDWDDALARARAHVARFESGTTKNEFLPVATARRLAANLAQLVTRAHAAEHPDALRLAWIALRYFEIADDGELDFSLGGLDDDVAVFDAICRHLGFQELLIEPD